MSTSRTHRLRLSDLRRLYRLVGKIRELRTQPTMQRQRMVNGLCELIGAWHGFSVHFTNFTPDQWVQATSVVTGGAPDSRTLKWFAEWAAYSKLNDDPLVDACTRLTRPVGAVRRLDLEERSRTGTCHGHTTGPRHSAPGFRRMHLRFLFMQCEGRLERSIGWLGRRCGLV